jgi:hypothetical protein
MLIPTLAVLKRQRRRSAGQGISILRVLYIGHDWTYLVAVSSAALPALDVLLAAVRRALSKATVGPDIDALVVSYICQYVSITTTAKEETVRTLQGDVIIPSIGNPELLLRNVYTFVQVQVGSILSSDDTEIETKVLGRGRIGGDLDLG